eukprot:gene17499-biopygen12882
MTVCPTIISQPITAVGTGRVPRGQRRPSREPAQGEAAMGACRKQRTKGCGGWMRKCGAAGAASGKIEQQTVKIRRCRRRPVPEAGVSTDWTLLSNHCAHS